MPNIVAKVVALKAHTAFGQSYDVGDAYELDEEFAATVLAQGMARRENATDVPRGRAKPRVTPARKPLKKKALHAATKKKRT